MIPEGGGGGMFSLFGERLPFAFFFLYFSPWIVKLKFVYGVKVKSLITPKSRQKVNLWQLQNIFNVDIKHDKLSGGHDIKFYLLFFLPFSPSFIYSKLSSKLCTLYNQRCTLYSKLGTHSTVNCERCTLNFVRCACTVDK